MELRVLRTVAVAAALAMLVTVVVGLASAPEGAAGELLGNVWGRVTVIDLYLAFGLAWAWIAWRERSVGRAALWAVLVATTGSIALWGYVAIAAARSRTVPELLLGPVEIGDE